MNGIQLAVLVGGLIGGGIWAIIARLTPVHADLAQSLRMLTAVHDHGEVSPPEHGWRAIGAWGLQRLPAAIRPLPTADLALLDRSATGFLATKMAYGLVGLFLPGLLTGVDVAIGSPIPLVIPAVGALVGTVIGFVLPDFQLRTAAVEARREWVRGLACFVDLVALERACGSGSTQALSVAAEVSDSVVFRRLQERLDHCRWSGQAAWDGLQDLAQELDLPDLSDVADIIRLSGTEGAGVYRTLRRKRAACAKACWPPN
ncbi:MAG: hypothetical protein LBV06_09180 [Propionibacteriaceae bacterium]|jgi:hypothetical protein|nr:hypothetical protein [Propionibacteriaceae bacterium]